MTQKYEIRDPETFSDARRAAAQTKWSRMTPQERSEHARRMAEARWAKKRQRENAA